MLSTTKSSIVVEEEAAALVQVAEDTGSASSTEEEEENAEAYVGAAAPDAEDSDDDDDGPAATVMSWTEYVVAYKRLSASEINDTLSRQRKPFESSFIYEDMVADGSTTREDLEREAAEHEYAEDALSEMQARVRGEFADKGFIAVDDDAIAERLELEQYFNETWPAMLAELGLDDNAFAE